MTLPGWLVVAPIRVMWSRCLRCHLRIFQSRFSRCACKLLPIVQIIIHMNCFFKPCDWRLIDDELKIVVQARAVHRILDTRESLLSTSERQQQHHQFHSTMRDVGIMPSKYATLPRYDNEPNKWDAYFVSKWSWFAVIACLDAALSLSATS